MSFIPPPPALLLQSLYPTKKRSKPTRTEKNTLLSSFHSSYWVPEQNITFIKIHLV